MKLPYAIKVLICGFLLNIIPCIYKDKSALNGEMQSLYFCFDISNVLQTNKYLLFVIFNGMLIGFVSRRQYIVNFNCNSWMQWT